MATTDNGTGWGAVLAGPLGERALDAVAAIAQAVQRPAEAWIPTLDAEPFRIARGISLRSGSSGLALFLAYAGASVVRVPALEEHARRMVDHAAAGIEAVETTAGFMDGFTGVLWAMDQVAQRLGTDFPGLDETLQESCGRLLGRPVEADGYDLWSGIIGHGVFALARGGTAAADRLVADVVDRLLRLYETSLPQAPWVTQPAFLKPRARLAHPHGFASLGVAHGVAGAVAFLAMARSRGLAPESVSVICDSAWRWIIAQETQDELGRYLPNKICPQIQPTRGMEFWCNGTPGLTAVLLTAAGHLGHEDMRAWAVARAKRTADELTAYEFADGCLCHGAAGLGHIFNRMAQATGDSRLRDAATDLFGRTLALRTPGRGVAGFVARGYNRDGELCDLYEPGLMQGAAGIGLALLAAATEQTPDWDRALLLA